MTRVHNFNAGPAAIPLAVLERVRAELPEWNNTGMSEMELSHRSGAFETILEGAQQGLRRLLRLPPDFEVLFLQGGASLQFAMVPMNLLGVGSTADYLVNGAWGEKALSEGRKLGEARSVAPKPPGGYTRLPAAQELDLDPQVRYLHFTSNETIDGLQWAQEPESNGVPLVCDASSDILSRPIDAQRYGLIYAGAQKNIGPAGVTVVLMRRDWIEERPQLPTMLAYATHAREHSLYNTPNTFGIYIIGLVCEWIDTLGGLEAMQRRNAAKAALLYGAIDASDWYRGHVEPEFRSAMNVTFHLPTPELETLFAKEATAHGLVGLKGHRSVGGLRASLYNAVELTDVEALVSFMHEFEREQG